MENLVEYIDQMVAGTKDGKIIWTKLNDNTFVWKTSDSNDKKINLILQNMVLSSADSKKTGNVLFRLFDVENRKVIFDVVSDKTSDENRKKIIDLFHLVRDISGLEKLNVLGDLLKKI